MFTPTNQPPTTELRDLYAIAALPVIMEQFGKLTDSQLLNANLLGKTVQASAKAAYVMADEMMKAREVKQ